MKRIVAEDPYIELVFEEGRDEPCYRMSPRFARQHRYGGGGGQMRSNGRFGGVPVMPMPMRNGNGQKAGPYSRQQPPVGSNHHSNGGTHHMPANGGANGFNMNDF